MRAAPPGGTRTQVTREIDADPTSTALLLAGPTALDLWPGVRRVGEVDGRLLVETELPAVPGPRATAATVLARPPRRTPTAYVTTFAWSGPDLPGTQGELVLAYLPRPDRPATSATLTLDSVGLEASELDQRALRRMAEAFLANLARAAEERCRAA